MKSKKNIYARLGLLTKALFFLCIGVVTALEAFGLGGFKAGTSTLLNVIVKEEYGRAILILFAAGLFGYVFWRVYESIVDNENYGTSLNGLAQRIAFCFGGLVYAFIALNAIQVALQASGVYWFSSSDFQDFRHSDLGSVVVLGAAIGMLGGTCNEFYIAFSRIFTKTIHYDKIPDSFKKWALAFGIIGYASRGFTLGVAALLLLDAAFTNRDISSANKEAAFTYMQYNFGTFILGIIALGFIVYSFYVLVEVRYRKIFM
ncbi:MAG: DUF1206 domain-containing protein [Bacteroidota bacterium]|nr:DUF1206 domain-containing protein [Bacteroidota bacterium]